jgi:hypothetical protein
MLNRGLGYRNLENGRIGFSKGEILYSDGRVDGKNYINK